MERVPIREFQITNTGDEPGRSCVPQTLSPNPPLQMDGMLNRALAEAVLVSEASDGIPVLLPDPDGTTCACPTLVIPPILSLIRIRRNTGLSHPVASTATDILVEQGLAREFTGRRRARLFANSENLGILNERSEVKR